MDRGYVKLWRKTLDSGLLQSPAALQLFTWLLLTASRTPRKMTVNGAVVELQPGEAVFTRARVANALDITEKQARSALDKLKSMQIVATKGTNKYTVVSIINWDIYQTSGPANGPNEGQQWANNGPTDGVASSNINKKEELRILNTPPLTPPKGEDAESGENSISSPEKENPETSEKPEKLETTGNPEKTTNPEKETGSDKPEKPEKPASKKVATPYTKEFEDFWKVYPRKVGKDAAFRAFRNKKSQLPSIPLLCAIIERQAHTEQWRREGGRFIPNPSTWLNQGRWQDEIPDEKNAWTEKPANW